MGFHGVPQQLHPMLPPVTWLSHCIFVGYLLQGPASIFFVCFMGIVDGAEA
jgi:hypothetical protein